MIATISADIYAPQPTASGTGVDSQQLWEVLDAASDHFLQPVNVSEWRDALTAMRELPINHSQPGWDGEDAEALSEESGKAAWDALASLFVARAPAPDIMVDPDGEVAFEWARPGRSVIFTFLRNGAVSHTALYNGTQEQPGTLAFTKVIPASLLDKIARVYQ